MWLQESIVEAVTKEEEEKKRLMDDLIKKNIS